MNLPASGSYTRPFMSISPVAVVVLPSKADSRELRTQCSNRRPERIEPLVIRCAAAVADRLRRSEVIRVEVQRLIRAILAHDLADLAIPGVQPKAFFLGRSRAVELSLVQVSHEVARRPVG